MDKKSKEHRLCGMLCKVTVKCMTGGSSVGSVSVQRLPSEEEAKRGGTDT